ncbi:MAG: fumarate reductase/succinate dehydrogenase flavoprotein subunit, partial [Bacteroidales bacterium]|nr:fumarate reductase/succinate dehydrogenase flavoprotein subunit [Bacteroidales bacterium]
ELAELLVTDALERRESCGAHFREEFRTSEGEALRNDKEYACVTAWEYKGNNIPHALHREELVFTDTVTGERNYK